VKRRDALVLLVGGSMSLLLGDCVATPSAPTMTVPTPLPTVAPTGVPNTPVPATRVPPTPVPATAIPPTLVPTPRPTMPPTPMPTPTPSPALAQAVQTAMERAIQRGVQPGGVVLIRHRGQPLLHAAFGLSRKYEAIGLNTADSIAATTDTLYDLASISKLFTTTCVMRLVEQGKLGLDDPVARSVPEFAANGKGAITLRQLLTHTSGLVDYSKLWELEDSPGARLARVLRTAPLNPPGTVFKYSDLGLIVLGHLVSQVAGMSLDRAVRDLVTQPLGLSSTLYRPPPELKRRIAPTEDESNVGRGMVWGEVHDENAWSLGGVAGHAGLFGTAADLAAFAQVYLDGGAPLLRPESVAEMTRNQIGALESRGLGWELDADYYMGRLASPTTYGHTGFTGTSLVVDPRRQLIVVLLANRVHPTRAGPSQNPVRQQVADAALAAADTR
jgi:CubicO group peptidase (beta-lactamase class C family)